MENRLSILERVVVIVTCSDGSKMRYDDYYYCGNGMLAYYNPDYARYPKENNYFECFGKFGDKYGPSYYIPPRYIDKEKTYKFNRLTLVSGCSLEDFRTDRIIDNDTMETSHLNSEGYDWYEKLKENARKYLECYERK